MRSFEGALRNGCQGIVDWLLAGMRVTSKFSGIGKTITEAGLRGIEGLYLVGIDRANGESLRVVQPDTFIQVRQPWPFISHTPALIRSIPFEKPGKVANVFLPGLPLPGFDLTKTFSAV